MWANTVSLEHGTCRAPERARTEAAKHMARPSEASGCPAPPPPSDAEPGTQTSRTEARLCGERARPAGSVFHSTSSGGAAASPPQEARIRETGAAAHGKEKRPRSGGGRHPSEQLRPPPGTSRSARGRRPRVPPRVRATVCALSGGCHSEGAGRLCIKPGARRFSEAPRQPLRSTG
ncbi:unnamed protein product [Prorocentrum cordatum]|uniref:Uncharacterized protein n=1 Tax=Prorocentrum cordatum TaxID=2364126 RepID=A0ABN9RNG8_9DINO|nr:unnamed protein product [Polarella glacialis]